MAGQALRIVLIGKVGVGKSATGNTLLGREAFTSAPTGYAVTETCQKGSAVNAGRYIDVVDTPGILDPDRDAEDLKREILRCITVSCPGPHAFLLVLQLGRFTKEEQNAVKGLQEIFGERAQDYMIVVFTRGDELHGKTIHEFVFDPRNVRLQTLVKSCGRRFHLINNMSNDVSQVRGLMSKIDQMVALNGGSHFSEAMYMEVDQVVRQRGAAELDYYQFSFLMYLLQRVIRFQEILDN